MGVKSRIFGAQKDDIGDHIDFSTVSSWSFHHGRRNANNTRAVTSRSFCHHAAVAGEAKWLPRNLSNVLHISCLGG